MTHRPDDPAAPDDAGDRALEQALRRSREFEDAPEALIQRAIDIFQPRAAVRAPAAPELLRRVVATLGFDSAAGAPQALGLRAAGGAGAGGGARQLLYTAEERDIDLRVVPAADGRHWQISGQVLGPETAGRAELRCADRVAEVAWNELAEFRFDAVPAGRCTLTLRAADWELALPPLELGG
ncbi:MAG: hypothetical protein ACLGIT_02290 [Gammaproteobacteria bacterium]